MLINTYENEGHRELRVTKALLVKLKRYLGWIEWREQSPKLNLAIVLCRDASQLDRMGSNSIIGRWLEAFWAHE